MLGFYNYTVILTYMSLCSGVAGIWFCAMGHPGAAIICLMFSGLCDAFDGRVARMRTDSTEQEKKFGIQLDSLCDLICFGVLPCCIGWAMGLKNALYVPVFCFFVLAALIRLAYFNVTEEERQQQTTEKRKNYQGLPVTSSAVVFPFFFLAHFIKVISPYSKYIYFCALVLTGILFIVKSLKIKKPNLTVIMILIFFGLAELAILIILKHLN